jgi:hypothetical protein
MPLTRLLRIPLNHRTKSTGIKRKYSCGQHLRRIMAGSDLVALANECAEMALRPGVFGLHSRPLDHWSLKVPCPLKSETEGFHDAPPPTSKKSPTPIQRRQQPSTRRAHVSEGAPATAPRPRPLTQRRSQRRPGRRDVPTDEYSTIPLFREPLKGSPKDPPLPR